jgi:tRNA splicing endonuclease
MSRQIRVTLNETELALLEAVQEQENLSSIHAALTRVLGRFAREHVQMNVLEFKKGTPQAERDVPDAAEIEARICALAVVEDDEIPELEPEPETPIIPTFCDDSLLDIDGQETFKTYEAYLALREKGHIIVDAVSFETALRAQAFIDNPPNLSF